MIFGLVKKIRAAVLWVSALELAAKSEYDQALMKLSAIEQMKIGLPLPIEFDLLKGLCYQRVGEHDLAVSHIVSANEHLDASQQYGKQDKKYLTCYSSKLILHSLWNADSKLLQNVPGKLLAGVDFVEIDLEQVQESLKMNFPVRDHPDWV